MFSDVPRFEERRRSDRGFFTCRPLWSAASLALARIRSANFVYRVPTNQPRRAVLILRARLVVDPPPTGGVSLALSTAIASLLVRGMRSQSLLLYLISEAGDFVLPRGLLN